MGIKGLNAFLRKKSPSCFIELPSSYFQGKRVAIDSDNVLFRFKCRAWKEIVDQTDVTTQSIDEDLVRKRFIYHVKYYLIGLLKTGVTPIFVTDGEYIMEKSKTQLKRREDKQKLIRDAKNMKSSILELDELDRTPSMITDLRKKMHHLGSLSREDKDIVLDILSAVGIPVLRATGEGEQLCAMLCIEGKVDAVYSRDSDLTAFGCPLTINEPSGYIYNEQTKLTEEGYKCTTFKPVLRDLQMEYQCFVDLCIMSGCDFNDNIPHLGVGKSYNLLIKHNSIDELPDNLHRRSTCVKHETCKRITEEFENQIDCLNHVRCREIFKHQPSSEICQDEIILDINVVIDELRDRLQTYGAEDWIKDVVPLYKDLPRPSNDIIEKRPSLQRSKLKLNIIGLKKSSPKYVDTNRIIKLNLIQHQKLNN